MEGLLFSITWCGGMTLGIIMIFFYTPACFNLKAMLDSIKRDGNLTTTKAPWGWYRTSFYTFDSWTISLPTAEKYLQYDIVKKTTEKIRLYRKFMIYLGPICIISFIFLLLFFTKK